MGTTISRRLFAAVAALVALPAVAEARLPGQPPPRDPPIYLPVPPPRDDADLIAVCAEFIACDVQQRAIYDGPDRVDDDDECATATAPIFVRMAELLDRMGQLRATTADGVAARASALAQHAGHWQFSFDAQNSWPGRLLDYLMRDAAALGRA